MNHHLRHHLDHHVPVRGVSRRGAIQMSIGAALASVLGPTLPRVFGAEGEKKEPRENSVILLWLKGGPFQQDSFDPKETADEKLALKFKPMATAADGLQLAACLPNLAEQAAQLTLIRSLRGELKEHTLASYHVQTGYRPTGPIQAPAMGSIVSQELGRRPAQQAPAHGLPLFISIGHAGFSPGHYGPPGQPFVVWDPTAPPDQLGLPIGISVQRQKQRLAWLRGLEEGRPANSVSRNITAGREAALAFMNSTRRDAFDLSREPAERRDAYGRSKFGQGCLLARRLVESGVRFVQVQLDNFDHHENHYPQHEKLMTQLDQGMSALITDLGERQLLDHVTVLALGEFGRTPVLNNKKGRDHWIEGFSAAIAGGRFQRGQVYGATSADGREITDRPVTIPDFMATLLHSLAIDPEKEYIDQFERPIKLVDHGQVHHELLS
ncbi:MAG: DUF1501 domain-containing protein [Planctomycetota bacterium]|nr:DUF1501 domain-containing protein [Planctomycetota bacterium]